jgi:aspartate racemase
MKTLGLIGGTGPESTIDYYRLLTAQYREKVDGASPPLIINSVDLKRLLAWMTANELGKVADYLVEEVEKLRKAGATSEHSPRTRPTSCLMNSSSERRCR